MHHCLLMHSQLLATPLIFHILIISSTVRFVQNLLASYMLMSKLNQNGTERELVHQFYCLLQERQIEPYLPKLQRFKIPVSQVEKEDLRFDIPVTHPISVDVRQRVE